MLRRLNKPTLFCLKAQFAFVSTTPTSRCHLPAILCILGGDKKNLLQLLRNSMVKAVMYRITLHNALVTEIQPKQNIRMTHSRYGYLSIYNVHSKFVSYIY